MNYTPSTDFSAKDSLLSGNPSKVVRGTEISAELASIQAAVASKYDSATIVPLTAGGTGAVTAAEALVSLGERTAATGSAILPAGTTAQRDGTPQFGYQRANSTTGSMEWWNGTTWTNLDGAASGANSDITSLGVLQSINGGQLAGLRNRIINGNFGINQRAVSGTVVLTAGVYGHDRFKGGASGATYTFATVDNVTTLTISAGSIAQVIEGLNLETGTYTLSWTGTAQGKIGAGSYGASGITGSITGGTNTTIEFGTGTVSKVQLEFGTKASVFEQRPYGMELALCQRYYEIGRLSGSCYFQTITSNAADNVNATYSYKVTKRVAPTVTVITNSGGGTLAQNYSADTDFGYRSTRAMTIGAAMDFTWKSEAEL